MNILEAITTRRNIKHFKPDPIEWDQIVDLLQAGSYAPNHRLTEPWEVIRIGPSTRSMLHHKTNFGGAPEVLAIISTPAKTDVDRDEHYAAVACFILNFMLAAMEKGIGTGWSSFGVSKHIREILGVAEGYDVVGLIPMGYPLEIPEAKPRTSLLEKIKELP